MICQFKGYSGHLQNIGRVGLAPHPVPMALHMVGYGFDEVKRLTIRKPGLRSFRTE